MRDGRSRTALFAVVKGRRAKPHVEISGLDAPLRQEESLNIAAAICLAKEAVGCEDISSCSFILKRENR